MERYVPSHYSVDEKELTEIVMPLDGDWVDLEPAVEDHILLSIPLQVLSQEELSEDKNAFWKRLGGCNARSS